MNKHVLSKAFRDMKLSLSKHSPEILIGIGITGMLTSTVLAVKATPKALTLIDQKKKELDVDKLTPVDTVKTAWRCYIPAAITGTAAIACIIGSNSVHAKRYSALATAYKLSETAFSEYRDKVVETIGEKKERTVRDKVSKDQVENNPIHKTDIIVTGKGNTLCFDPLSHRYFYSDLEKIHRAANNLNYEINTSPFNDGVTLNSFYFEIGLPGTAVGDNMGWNIHTGLIKVYPSAQMVEEGEEHEGEPCVVLNFENPPRYDYDKFA